MAKVFKVSLNQVGPNEDVVYLKAQNPLELVNIVMNSSFFVLDNGVLARSSSVNTFTFSEITSEDTGFKTYQKNNEELLKSLRMYEYI